MRRTYQLLLVAAAALSAAGVAFAQADNRGNPGYGANSQQPAAAFMDGNVFGYSEPPTARRVAANEEALQGYRLACAADRATLCTGKDWRHAQLRCVQYYRLKLSPSCKSALIQLDLAAQGAL